MKIRLYHMLALAALLAACEKEPAVQKSQQEEEPAVELPDSIISHTLGQNDVELAKRTRLSAQFYSPSKIKTSYFPILVNRSVGSVSSTGSVTWRAEKTRILYNMPGFTPDTSLATYNKLVDKYGGNKSLPRQEATGRYYVKKIGERWWIVDPDGYLRYERSVASFRRGGSERCNVAWNSRFGSNEAWLRVSAEELSSKGIHGTGAFCTNAYNLIQEHNTAHPDTPLSLSPSVGFIGTFKSRMKYDYPKGPSGDDYDKIIGLVFYEGWEQFCKDYAKEVYAQYKGDKNVLGVYSDNEIDFSSANGTTPRLLDRFIAIVSDTDPAKKAALDFLASKGKTVKDELDDWDNAEFAGIVATRYYKAISEAIKEFDPGMMYLGSRLHGQPKYLQGVIEAAGKYCDIISINYYSRWSPELTTKISQWEKWTDAPFMVTEFYTKGLDNDLANTSGAGFAVPTQYDRAYAYQHFTLGLLEARHCVGWQWFKYQDDDYPDNSNQPCNKGLYDNNYRMYPYLADYMKNINFNVYSLIDFFDSKQ